MDILALTKVSMSFQPHLLEIVGTHSFRQEKTQSKWPEYAVKVGNHGGKPTVRCGQAMI